MKLELVSEERLDALYQKVTTAHSIPVDYAEFCLIARAVLEELGVRETMELDKYECVTVHRLDVASGGILLRAK